jgi:Asp-tRNA(Asn)/Glu-tRNA(Gln) amidotransferase A subunit family amidase
LAIVLVTLVMPAAAQRRPTSSPAQPAIDLFDVTERSIDELQAEMTAGRVTSRALVESYLARIAAYDQAGPRLNAIVRLNPRAREDADAVDRERTAGRVRGPLHGIPVLVKDNYDTADMPTSAGTLALATLRPAEDASQVKRLREAGAVILGKTALHELASGITTISSLTGQTRNPYDLMRNPGGSSGGTGAAVAASFAAAGMGSDTCGSIRIPAAHQNLVGLRPTLGLSSRAGVIPLSVTQDTAGPLARTVADLALVLDATVGPDPRDPTTADAARHVPRSYRDSLKADALKGARIGVLRALFGTAPEDNEVRDIVQKALDGMKAQGTEIVDVVVPGLDDLLRDSSVINDEFKFDLAEYLAHVPNAPVKSLGEILDRGLEHAALEQNLRARANVEKKETEHYRQAMVKRRALREAVLATLEAGRVTALAYPTLRRRPALIGEAQGGTNCQLSATTGLPALTMPAGFTPDGVPIAVELLGEAFAEPHLLGLAYAWEQASKLRRPPFSTPSLVGGRAPAPVAVTVEVAAPAAAAPTARVAFTFDRTTGSLRYNVAVRSVASGDAVLAATLQRGEADKPGPIVAHLVARGQLMGADTIVLRGRDREDFAAGRLYAHLYTEQWPLGVGRALVKPPER